MKTKVFSCAISLIVLALASIAFTACSGDDAEPTIDELLSEETTPVTFALRNGNHYLFDYAGNVYIGSDTIEIYNGKDELNRVEVELRQGLHHLLWLIGLSDNQNASMQGVFFNPYSHIITTGEQHINAPSIKVAVHDINVSEYLLPAQKLSYNSLEAEIRLEVVDYIPEIEVSLDGIPYSQGKTIVIGSISGYPVVSSVSLFGQDYSLSPSSTNADIMSHSFFSKRVVEEEPTDTLGGSDAVTVCTKGYYTAGKVPVTYYEKVTEVLIDERGILCPLNGLDNIQLYADVHDTDGNPISTTTLPQFSIRRGYTTILRGPLFSGSTSDWMVTMQPYDE